jgi:hypothetical protein
MLYVYTYMFMRLKNTNDITKYCVIASCIKDQSQKDLKRVNTSSNVTQITRAMRYSQYVRNIG